MHYLFSFCLLFIFLPRLFFTNNYQSKFEYWYSGYIKMILLLIISGYILVIIKLYEVLGLLIMFLLLIGIRYKRMYQKDVKPTIPRLLKFVFDYLDGITKTSYRVLSTNVIFWIRESGIRIRETINWYSFTVGIALIFTIGDAAYIRFYDAFVNAAPPLSDSYVTLAWMKYINNRQLFHDGIYPQGFHIYLASLSKFAAVDALYILKYTGPLNTLMITVGMYVVVQKLTKNAIGGLTAAWLYGIMWVILPLFSTDRQAATNSQEFAFVFVFPAIFFLIKFFQNEKREDLVVGLISMAIIGLVHSLGYALLILMVGILIFSAFITLKKNLKIYIQIVVGVILTGILSILPMVLGYLLGKNLNASSADYLVSQSSTYHFKMLNNVDYTALGSLLILLLLLFRKTLSNEERFLGCFTLLTGLSVFTIYFAGGFLTHSTVIDSRSVDLWGLTIPFFFGISISFLINALRENWGKFINILMIFGLLCVTFVENPKPIIPYKLEYNENIEQYLRISHQYLPQTWMIVSQNEGYSIVLGKGYHMLLGNFLKTYNPNAKPLTKFGESSPDKNIPPHIFVFQEKKVFEVSKSNSVYSILAPEYKQRAKQYKELSKWIEIYKRNGYHTKIYYQDNHIIIYEFVIPENNQN